MGLRIADGTTDVMRMEVVRSATVRSFGLWQFEATELKSKCRPKKRNDAVRIDVEFLAFDIERHLHRFDIIVAKRQVSLNL